MTSETDKRKRGSTKRFGGKVYNYLMTCTVRREAEERKKVMKMGKKKNWWNKLAMWKKGAILGAVIGGGWLILGGIITLYIASTGSTPSSWKFMIDSFPIYTLFVPLGILDFGERLSPPGLPQFLFAPIVALYWAAIGAVIGYLIDMFKK